MKLLGSLGLVVLLVLVLELWIGSPAVARGQEPKKQVEAPATKVYAQEYFQSFKEITAKPSDWDLEGPEADECVRFEATGLHFILPLGSNGDRKPTGVKTTFGVRGDFEITMNFEVIAEPLQADAGTPIGTRFNLGIVKDPPKGDKYPPKGGGNLTNISRMLRVGSGLAFVGWSSVWSDKAGKSVQNTGTTLAAQTKVGRLRLVRSGADVSYGMSDAAEENFTFFKNYPFGPEDLREVRIMASTGGDKALLDLRVTDFRIRADAILANVPAPPQPGGGGRLALALSLGLAVTVLLAFGVVAWLYRRQRK